MASNTKCISQNELGTLSKRHCCLEMRDNRLIVRMRAACTSPDQSGVTFEEAVNLINSECGSLDAGDRILYGIPSAKSQRKTRQFYIHGPNMTQGFFESGGRVDEHLQVKVTSRIKPSEYIYVTLTAEKIEDVLKGSTYSSALICAPITCEGATYRPCVHIDALSKPYDNAEGQITAIRSIFERACATHAQIVLGFQPAMFKEVNNRDHQNQNTIDYHIGGVAPHRIAILSANSPT